MKEEAKQMKFKKKKKLEFLGSSLRMQKQACVRRQDYAYTGSCPESPKNTTKPKTLNLTF